VTEEWRKLYNKELNDLYSSPTVVRVIKSRRIRWAGHVALIIIIIIFINCKWVDTRWQWSFYILHMHGL
jgi:hypothetical protein